MAAHRCPSPCTPKADKVLCRQLPSTASAQRCGGIPILQWLSGYHAGHVKTPDLPPESKECELTKVSLSQTTSTITITVPAYSDSPLTYQFKRSFEDVTAVDSSITVPPQPSITQHFVKRASSTSFYPSMCTENPTAISSGCSCFLPTFVKPPPQSSYHPLLPLTLSQDFHCHRHSHRHRRPAPPMRRRKQLRPRLRRFRLQPQRPRRPLLRLRRAIPRCLLRPLLRHPRLRLLRRVRPPRQRRARHLRRLQLPDTSHTWHGRFAGGGQSCLSGRVVNHFRESAGHDGESDLL